MKFSIVTHSIDVKIDSIKDVVTLIPFSDIHRDTKLICEERWKGTLSSWKGIKSRNKHTYFIGLGDYNDLSSGSERSKINNIDLHDSTRDTLDHIAEKSNRLLANELSFMKGTIIGLSEGNHHWISEEGINSTEDLCERLNTKYLGWIFIVKLNIIYRNSCFPIWICGCHGKYSGKRAGATFNAIEDMAQIFPMCDIYLQGHDHQLGIRPDVVLIQKDESKKGIVIKEKSRFFARTGSFMRAYVEGKTSYVAKGLMKPSYLGNPMFNISLERNQKDGNESSKIIINGVV